MNPIPRDRIPEDFLLFTAHDPGLPLVDLVERYSSALQACGFGPPVMWAVGPSSELQPGEARTLLDEIERLPETDRHYAEFETQDRTLFAPALYKDGWQTRVRRPVEELGPPDPAWLSQVVDLVRRFIPDERFKTANLQRVPSRATRFVPSPPLLRTNHVIVTSDNAVAEAYGTPERWQRSWSEVERHGDRLLAHRALDAIDEPSWLHATFEDHMDLARAARPGQTKYGPLHPCEWTRPWLESDESVLSLVGYHPGQRLTEYAAWVEADQHVPIRELLEIRELVRRKEDPSGRPVETVRVVFLDEAAARRERRPLMDVGGRVFFHGPTGELIEVSD